MHPVAEMVDSANVVFCQAPDFRHTLLGTSHWAKCPRYGLIGTAFRWISGYFLKPIISLADLIAKTSPRCSMRTLTLAAK